jgi:DNA-binding MarR family transcriptional regulator
MITADSLARVEREVTVLVRRTLEAVWVDGYGDDPAVDRYTYPALVLLDAHGPQRLTELTGRLGVSKPTASRQVARLSAAGLVATGPYPYDPRAVLVRLTEAGAERVRGVRDKRRESLGRVLEDWSGEDSATLARLLRRLNEDLERHRAGGVRA